MVDSHFLPHKEIGEGNTMIEIRHCHATFKREVICFFRGIRNRNNILGASVINSK